MKKWTGHLPRLNRKQRVVRNLLCALALLFCCWLAAGAPELSPRRAFQQEAEALHVGPMEILGVVTADWETENCYRYLVAGENQWGYAVCVQRIPGSVSLMYYREKGDTVTLIPANARLIGSHDYYPWVLFTELPAARAQMELTFDAANTGVSILKTHHFKLDAQPQEGGWFLFLLSGQSEYDDESSSTQSVYLSSAIRNLLYANWGESRGDFDVIIRLWDENDVLIYEEVLKNGREVREDEN